MADHQRGWSEQRSLGGHADATWEPLGAWAGENERPIAEGCSPGPLDRQPYQVEPRSRPAIWRPARVTHRGQFLRRGVAALGGGVAHQQPAPDLEKRRRTLRCDGRWTESSGDDDIEAAAQGRVPAGLLGAGPDHRHARREAEAGDRRLEEGGPPSRGVQEDQLGIWPGVREHEAGNPATAPEVEDPVRGDARRTDGPRGEPESVVHLDAHGAGPEETQAPAPCQNALDAGGLGRRHAAAHQPPDPTLTPGG
jgi:hypothetical protein